MNKLLHSLCAIILTVTLTNVNSAEVSDNKSAEYAYDDGVTAEPFITTTGREELEVSTLVDESLEESAVTVANEGRRIAQSYDNDASGTIDVNDNTLQKKQSEPLKNIFRSIYKNYKSTYMGNATSAEYKNRLRQRLSAATATAATTDAYATTREVPPNTTARTVKYGADESGSATSVPPALAGELHKHKLRETQRKRKRKYKNRSSVKNANKSNQLNRFIHIVDNVNTLTLKGQNNYRYNLGPGVNMSFDMLNNIVNVKLDGDNLRELMRGRWLSDNTEEGRGKKYDMMTKVLPLFILPFLIQSAIVPFLVTKLKLLLMKSILVGKLAIVLLILSAIKNSNKMVQSYEVAPSYWASEPSRRSELAAVPSSTAYNGYRVEGKPTAWIN